MIWMLACGDDPTIEPTDTNADADTDSDTDSDTDTDSDSDTDTDVALPYLSAVTPRLHEDFGTVVYIGWTQDRAGAMRVDYLVDEGEWRSSPEVERGAGSWEQVLVGLPYDTHFEFKILADGVPVITGGGTSTGPAPLNLPLPTLEISDPSSQYAEGQYLLTSVNEQTGGWTGGPFWTVILDRRGRVVWARRSDDWTLFAQVSTSTGTELLIDNDTMWSNFDQGLNSTVVRTTLEHELDETSTPGLQHAFVEHADGTLAWGSIWHDPSEALVELAPGATDATVIWDCDEDWPPGSDCESNGLFWDEPTQSYLYSFWTNHSLVSVDRATGETLWWAGNVGGGYDFVPSGSQFWLQHGVSWTKDRTLLVSSEEDGPTTVAREYEVDVLTGELRELWTYDAGVHAVTNGDAWRLPNDNTLHVVGSAGVIDEVTLDLRVVWRVDWHAERLLDRGEWISDLYAFVD